MDIAIIGAGIGGLAAAAALAQDGHRVVVHERFAAPAPVGSGLVIQPVAQAVLDRIGAGGATRAAGARLTRLLGHEARRGRAILDVRYADGGSDGLTGLGIHRSALFTALLDAALGAGAHLACGRKVRGCDDGPRRRLIFVDGTTSAAFDLVVDASGARSTLSPLRARDLPYGAIWGTVDWPEDTDIPQTQLTQQYAMARRMAGVLPVGHVAGSTRAKAAIFWSMPCRALDAWPEASLETWKGEAAAFWPAFAPFVGQITQADQMTTARYAHGTLRMPVDRGLAYIGDAAHRASPQLGQGANMAILDAWALRAALQATPDLGTALQRYAAMRRWHVRLYQWASAAFTPMYQSDSRALPLLRDHVLTPLSRIPPVPRLLSRLVRGDLIASMGRFPLDLSRG